jgi:3-oxoacyl-[acyl-carrier-protein] synthase-3
MLKRSDLPEPGRDALQTTHSRLGRVTGVQIVGIGSHVPANVVRNEDLAELGCDADWILQRSGIRQRRHAEAGVATSDMAAEAARRCIENAGVSPADVDLIVLGTFTPDLLLPSTACLVQQQLGLFAPAMDVHAACASFAYALVTGMQFVATGCSRLALVIGADCNSRVVNPADVHTYPLFGDGGGAVLVAPGEKDQGLLAYAAGADGSGAELLYRPMGGTRLPFTQAGQNDPRHFMKMEGRPIFKWAVRMLRETIADTLRAANVALEEVDLFVFHQANIRIIDSAVKDVGIDPARVFNNLDRYGNTSSASIPLALDEANQQGRIRRGDLVLLSGFGAGLAWATALMRW